MAEYGLGENKWQKLIRGTNNRKLKKFMPAIFLKAHVNIEERTLQTFCK